MLTTTELERGWVEHVCPSHGFLIAGGPTLRVKCACGKAAQPERDGQRLQNRDIKALQLADAFSAIDALPSRKRQRGQNIAETLRAA